ncbi:MAG: response regulator [Myxococcales bacterium]|nr:response regulator [Myxococcales bacterium]
MAEHKKILVIDDDPFILEAVGSLLQKAGYRVATASNTMGAGYLLRDFAPDLVVLDIMLPGSFSGDQACATLRDLSPGIRIVFYSGIDQAQLRRLAEQNHADAWLNKGGRVSELIQIIDGLLGVQR